MTIINVCNLFVPIVGPLIGIINILILILILFDVAEWSRALDIKLSHWCCSVSKVRVGKVEK